MKSPNELLDNPEFPDPKRATDFVADFLPEIMGTEKTLDPSHERDAFKLAQQRIYYYIHRAQERATAGGDRVRDRSGLVALDKILAARDALDDLAARLGMTTDLDCGDKRVERLWFTEPPMNGQKQPTVRMRYSASVTLATKEAPPPV